MTVPATVPDMDANDASLDRRRRLAEARKGAGFTSARAAAVFHRWAESTYRAHETGTRNFGLEDALKYGEAFDVDGNWIFNGRTAGKPRSGTPQFPLPNASPRLEMIRGTNRRLNVLGSAAGGAFGEFVMNGQVVDTVDCPPALDAVPDAYAVYVVGDSMENRYFAGELVYVHPNKPYKRGDFVVVQINVDGEEAPHGFIKQFVSLSPTTLTLCQFNPKKEIEFPRKKVVSIHRIVGAMER
jgi:phage repressor protein C with HTH and peptisase S24 domain